MRTGATRSPRKTAAARAAAGLAAAVLVATLVGLPGSARAQTPARRLAVDLIDGALVLRLDPAPARDEGELVVWIDSSDVSALGRREGDSRWVLPAAALALLGSASQLELWLVHDGRWLSLGMHRLAPAGEPAGSAAPSAPLAAAAPEASPPAKAWRPRIDLALKAQLRAEARGTEPTPARPTSQDLTLRAALEADQPLGAYRLRGGAQLAGASYRPEALRFATLGSQAPKLDLADYRFELAGNDLSLAAGHLSIGSHPLLLDRFASRGLTASARGAGGWDVSLAVVNGSAIAGFANPLGLDDDGHQIQLLALGQELIPEHPGQARVELSWVDASTRALANVNRGEVPDAEKIRGLGLRLSSHLFDGRARAEFAFGRARHRAAEDPQLDAGAPLTPLADSTRSAWTLDLAFDLVRGWTGLAERLPLTLTLQARRARVDPLYKAVGAFLAADQDFERYTLAATLGTAQLQLFADRKRDNLDRLVTLLTTRTSNEGVVLALPAAVWSAGPMPAWLPGLTLQLGANAQRALDAPDFALTGLEPTHRPDQANRSGQLGLAWNIEQVSFGLNAQRSTQDNRQPGRERADFAMSGLNAQLGLPIGDQVNLALSAGHQRNHSLERDLTESSDSGTLAIDWRPSERWALVANLAAQRSRDSAGNAGARVLGVQAQLTRRFGADATNALGMTLPGQWFLRYAWVHSRRTDNVFGSASDGRLWTLQAGLGLSFGAP